MAGEQSTARPNFFILLGVSPEDSWDQEKFKETLKAKRGEWTRKSSGVGAVAMEARRNLALYGEIEAVMLDQGRRDDEALAAKKELQAGQGAKIGQFERQLEMLARKGFLEQTEVDKLINDFKDVLSVKDIRDRIKVPVQASDTQTTKTQQQLEPATVKAINERLQILQKKDLYDLLGMTPSVSNDQLLKAAQALGEDMLRRQPKTPEVTLKSELAGHAKLIFKTKDTRQKYDESLRYSTLNALLEELEKIVAIQKGRLYPGQVTPFLEQAAEARWSKDEAINKLNEFANKRRWFVEVPTIEIGNVKQRCGGCNALNDKGREFCAKCNGQLRFVCPDCGNAVGSDDVGCGKCSFPVGNRYWVDRLLSECHTLLTQSDLKAADEQLAFAEDAWTPKKSDTRLKRIQEYRAEIQRHRQAQQHNIEQVREYINRKQFFTARDYLARQRPDALPEKESYLQTINSEIAQAQTLLRQAKAASQLAQKFNLCVQSLRICTDYQEARDILSTVPPDAPRHLNVKAGNSTVSLQWEPSPTPNVSYKIVRKAHSQPVSVKDGQLLATISGRLFDDTHPEIGVPTFYAVFAAFEEITSPEAATLQRPVMLTADVTNLKARIDNRLIELTWKAPQNILTIVVVRKEHTPPATIDDGMQIAPLDLQHLIDRNVQNERIYYYSIFCTFKDFDGRIITSTGTTVSVTPQTPPEIIGELEISSQKVAQGYDVKLRWITPHKGEAIILKSAQPPGLKPTQELAKSELTHFGKLLQEHPDSCTDRGVQPGVIHYTPIVVFQDIAYIGVSQRLALIDDVSNLRYQNLGSALRLNWNWPANCQEAIVAFDYDGFPQLNGRTPNAHKVMRAEYEHRGFYDIRGSMERDHYIVVAAVIKQGNDEVIGTGIRAHARLVSKMILSYELKLPRMFGPKKRILSISSRAAGTLPDLVLVSKQGRLPLRREEGEPYYRIPGPTEIQGILEFELPDRSFGPKTLAKLYLEDDDLYEIVTIHHPSEEKLRLS